ncbi:aldehyde dehydrogenase family protein [Kyrpidia tusciae]|uniref:Aldehyde Dehydrogenase n=1 Tax=Kyrpidia tusciae (strain DSM 2912 / NBRC 15312 / T2) TaxID=562970 RepID=D5WXV6_KYRT2|nr:aldehyde dehydrogenase family protein [Kyrpidia tusciae]ADG06015.1 Aldehyde Dehydrogenase [Kyrpidia tusciae DSM 2912]
MNALQIEHVNVPTQLFIDGRFVDSLSGEKFAVVNPASGEQIGEVPLADEKDVDCAVQAARRVVDGGRWAAWNPYERERLIHRVADLIEAHADTLALLETCDTGKPLRDAKAVDIPLTIQCFRYYAGWPSKIKGETVPVRGQFLTYTLREPVGVVAQIIPWNFPLYMAAIKVAPALATGNAVVLKPAEETPLSALYLARLMKEAGIPDGVFNVVTGDGEKTGAALVRHPGVDKISFTGSTAVGQQIMAQAASGIKRVSLELGGKSPHIVFADADLSAAVKGIVGGIFYNQGEVCLAGSRVFVQRPVYNKVLEEVRGAARKVKIGNPLDESTTFGPLISAEHQSRVHRYVKMGVEEGAQLIEGGSAPANLESGYFYEPTILVGDHLGYTVAREEIFGPVAFVMPFDTPEEVVGLANDTRYGLAAGLWTRDLSLAHRTARALKAGTVWINAYNLLDAAAPFGGYRMSGFGRELGEEALDLYTELKTVWTSLR